MSGALETIKEYLVGLGFEVDKATYNQADKAIGSLESGLSSLASTAIKTFGKAAFAVAAFGAAATVATAKFLDGLGNQQIAMQKLSRQLWTTQQQATAFNGVMKSLGANLQDLYLSPTLMNQYRSLMGVANQLATPGDYNQQIAQIQAIQLQFKQLRLEAYYALQWIGYYFIKYMSGPISKVHDVLQSINKVIVKGMPVWTKRVADVMVAFVQAGGYIVQALQKVWKGLSDLAQYIPGWAKAIAAGLALISVSNPFMLLVEGIAAAIFLLDDFMTYIHGGNSEFPKFWSWLVKIGKQFKAMGIDAKVIQDTQNNAKQLGQALQTLGEGAKTLAQGIGNIFGMFSGSKKDGLANFFMLIWNMSNSVIGSVSSAITALGDLGKLVGDLLSGKWGDAWSAAKDFASNSMKSMPGMTFMTVPQFWGQPGVGNATSSTKKTPKFSSPNTTMTPKASVSASNPFSYVYPRANNYNTSNDHSTKVLSAPVTINQNIYGVQDPQVAKQKWYSGFMATEQQMIAAFKGLWP